MLFLKNLLLKTGKAFKVVSKIFSVLESGKESNSEEDLITCCKRPGLRQNTVLL